MKLCGRHASSLISTLSHKGLYKFVNTNPEVMEFRKQKWLAGIAAPSEICPLTICMLEINNKAEEFCGHSIVLPKKNGQPHCPLCEVSALIKHECDKSWIDNVTDAVHSLCLQNGIMNPTTVTH